MNRAGMGTEWANANQRFAQAKLAKGLADVGVELLPATSFMEECLAYEGHIAGPQPGRKTLSDLEYGFRIAKEISRLEIGQMVVVKNGTVLSDRRWGHLWETTDDQAGDAGVLTNLLASHDGAAFASLPEAPDLLLAEIDRLSKRVAELEGAPARSLQPARPSTNLPNKEEFGRAMDMAEDFMRRMMRIMRDETPKDRL